jgi:hypothetical protein
VTVPEPTEISSLAPGILKKISALSPIAGSRSFNLTFCIVRGRLSGRACNLIFANEVRTLLRAKTGRKRSAANSGRIESFAAASSHPRPSGCAIYVAASHIGWGARLPATIIFGRLPKTTSQVAAATAPQIEFSLIHMFGYD